MGFLEQDKNSANGSGAPYIRKRLSEQEFRDIATRNAEKIARESHRAFLVRIAAKRDSAKQKAA